jgi:hypothetical protein
LDTGSLGPLVDAQAVPPSCRSHSGEFSGASRLVDGQKRGFGAFSMDAPSGVVCRGINSLASGKFGRSSCSWGQLDVQVKEDKAVNVTVASPRQAPPSVEAKEECIPNKVVVGLWEPDSDAIVNELFEEWKTGLLVGNQMFYFEEAGIVVNGVYCGAGAHGTSACLLPKGVAELEDVAMHDFRQGFDDEVYWHA